MYAIREMTINDYDKSIELWRRTEGIALSDADSRESINDYLNRNIGSSFICSENEKIIGTILCGHDGRRGYIYHVAIDPKYRTQTIGQKLLDHSLRKLKVEGITKCHIMVIEDNEIGNHFWTKTGWIKRDNIFLYSSNT